MTDGALGKCRAKNVAMATDKSAVFRDHFANNSRDAFLSTT
jgi:hypothetical protein